MKTKEQVLEAISGVMHPAIRLSLTDLGIVNDIKIEGDTATAYFVFPFPNIPIAEDLIFSISQPIRNMDLKFKYEVRTMTEVEKQNFLELEAANWKGL